MAVFSEDISDKTDSVEITDDFKKCEFDTKGFDDSVVKFVAPVNAAKTPELDEEMKLTESCERSGKKRDALVSVADLFGKDVWDYVNEQIQRGILPGFILISHSGSLLSNAHYGYLIYDEDLARSYAKLKGVEDASWQIIKENENKWWQMDTYTDVVGFTDNKSRFGNLFQGEDLSAFRRDVTSIIEYGDQQKKGQLKVEYLKEDGVWFNSKGHYVLKCTDNFMEILKDIDPKKWGVDVIESRLLQNIEVGEPIFNQ